MSDIFDLYKAYAIGGPLGAAAQKGKLKVDYDDSDFERGLKVAGQTWLDFNSRLTKGLSKSIEGIVDLGLGIGAGVAGLFGADEAQRNLEKRIKYNWTEENFKSFDAQNTKSGLRGNKVGEFVGNVTEGIGGMVPAIATGGAGMAVMAAGAAGNATEKALNEGASLGSALAYGGFTGGIEAVTEKIGGFTFGGGKSLLGKVTAGTGLGKVLSKGMGKVAGDFISEGAEEVLADTLNPLVKKGTGVDKRSLKEQYSEVVPGLGETFLVGGTVGSVMSGGQSFMRNNANKSRGGARATRADDYLGYISEVSSNLNGENTDSRYERAINDSFLEVERELMQMSESARKNYLKSIEKTPFKLAFDEGGKYIGAKAESVNSQAITNNLRSVSANLKYKAIKADTEVSEDATRAKELIEDVLKDDGASVVITDELGDDTRSTYDSGVVYINNNMVFDDSFTNEAVAIHELAHYSEGTNEYNALVDALSEAGKIDEIQAYLESKKYSSTEYEGTTDKQQDYIDRTELAADVIGHLLSTPSALAKLRARNKNVFAKLKAALEASRDDTTSKEAKKAINKVLKNFEKAVDASQGGVLLSSIRDDEEKENTEREHGVRDERYSNIDVSKNAKKVINMQIVSRLNGKEFYDDGTMTLKEKVVGFFNSFGNVVNTKEIGAVTVNLSSFRDDKGHGLTRNKVISFQAIPDVLSNGYVIDFYTPIDKPYERITIAAPIEIVNEKYYMGVMVQRDHQSNRMYLHDVITEKATLSFNTEPTVDNDEGIRDKGHLYITSILQNALKVNINERNSKISEENSINLAKLNEITSTNAVENDYSDLQIEAKPRKKADKQEQKNVEPPKDEPKEKAEKPKRPLRVTAALTKQEGENVIAYIIDKHFKHFTEDTKTAFIPGEMKKQIIDDLINIAGTAEDAVYVGKVYDLAEKICNEIKVKEEYDYSDKADVQQATRTKQAIEEYRNKLNLDVIHDDIKSVFDTRTASLMKKWKDFKHRGISLDMAAQALREEGVRIDATNEADIFVEMVTQYDQAEEIVKKAHEKATLSVRDLLTSAEEKTALIEELADDLHTISKKNVGGEYFKASIKILHICQQFGDLKKGRYANATEEQDTALAEIYNNIKGIRGGAISITNLIKTFKFLKKWYSKDNKSIENHIDVEVAAIIDEISARDVSPLNTVELKNILKVLQRVKSLLENYTKIYRDGKNVEIKDVVDNDLKVIKSAETNNTSLVKFYKKGFFRNFGDPQFVCEIIDGYKKGFATALLNDFREGAIKYEKAKIDLLKEWDDFSKKNKTYLKELFKRTVKVNGVEVPMDVALSVLMTHKRAHAQQGLTFNGFDYEDKNGTSVKVEGVDRAAISAMSAQFTEKDKEFISVIENVFKKCKGFKEQTDMIRLGFTNTVSGYYYPIFRVHAKNIDSNDLFYQTDSVNNVHFNKNTVQGAKQRLIVKSAVKTLIDHVEGISRYYGYSIPIDNFNRVYNYNTVENRNDPVTVGTELNRGWGEGAKYLVKLAADAQGKRMEQGPGDKVIAALRSGYVKFQLGANPKVLVTQLSSYLAAFDKLSSKALVKGFGINGKDVDKYCTLAEIRNYSQQAVKAVSVKDELNNTTDKLMAPIGMVDRMVVCRLFGACQVEVNAKYGLEIGSEENKVKAGEMLKDLIFETQQNSFATERSAMMRGNSEFWRAMTMFSADSMKLWGRWLGSLGKYFTIRREIYLTRENMLINEDVRMKNIKILEGELADCKMVVGKTTATVMSVAAFMALIACAFRHLYRKDDEEENDIKTGAFDFIGNLVGMFPVARDVYSYFVDGFEISSFAIDSLNGVMSSLKKTIDLSYSIVKGDYMSTQNIVKTIKDTVNAAGQIIGLPTRNIYNVATGLTRRFSENAGYHVDSVFYEKSYSADLGKAIENGNDSLALTIVSMASAGDERYSGEVAQIISNLYGEGYNCLPRTISEKLTVAGVEYELTGKQHRTINQEYGKANTVINDMVGSASFTSLNAESQSKAIKFANDYYFAVATEKGLGISYNSDSSYYKKLVYGKLIDVKVLALAVAKVNELKSTAAEGENVRQKVRDYIESLALTAEQKYLLFNYFGYTSGVDKERMISYIKANSKLTAENKEYLLKRYN